MSKQTWAKIKNEYVADTMSMRDIAKKYGLAVSTISEKASKENWKEVREKKRILAEQKTVEKLADVDASNAELAMHTIHVLLGKIAQAADVLDPLDSQSMRQLVQCLKDLKEMDVYTVQAHENEIKIDLIPEVEEYSV